MNPKTCSNLLVGGGVTLMVVFAVLMGCFTPIFNSIVDKMVIISEDSAMYESFITPPVPVYMKFYFFHVTNPTEVLSYGEKPILEERGPYTYMEHRKKEQIDFSTESSTVDYVNPIFYTFVPELSEGNTEEDRLTTINMVMLLMASLGEDSSKLRMLWPQMEKEMEVYETHSVREWLFAGWELPNIDLDFSHTNLPPIKKIQDAVGDSAHLLTLNGSIPQIMRNLSIPVPDSLESNTFGYYSQLNNTNDGVYTVGTGADDIKGLLDVVAWNGDTELSFWNDRLCDMINGTDGTQFAPRSANKKEPVRMFVTQLCRSLYLNFDQEVPDMGMEVLRFIAPPEMLESGRTNPDNECFCVEDGMGCLGDSMIELSPCMPPGLPIVMSTPHFFQGDGEELSKFVGLSPNASLHRTYLDIQPALGVPVSAHKRIQLNLPLQRYSAFTSFYNLKDLIHPIFWADETADIEQEDIETMARVLSTPYVVVYSVGGVLIALGAVLTAVGVWRLKGATTLV